MRDRIKRMSCCALALIGLAASARAELSPRWTEFTRSGVTAGIKVTLEKVSGWSDGTLEAVNGILEKTEGTVARWDAGEEIKLLYGGETLFSASVLRRPNDTLTVFGPEGGAYLTGPGEKDALALLSGYDADYGLVTALPQTHRAAAPAFFAALGGSVAPKEVKESTSIKNALSSPRYETYLFPAEGLTEEIWQGALDRALPIAESALGPFGGYAEAEKLLRSLVFSGECRFKRFLDADGQDMGMEFTGRAGIGQDVRKATLYFGFTQGRGGYLSLRLPAVRGDNDLRLALEYRITEKNGSRSLSASGSYSRKYNGESESGEWSASLSGKDMDGQEAWTGKITLSRTKNKLKTAWTLTPDLTIGGVGLFGTVEFRKKEKNEETLRGRIELSAEAGADMEIPTVPAARDLRGLEEAEARARTLGEMEGLTRAAGALIRALPEDVRNHLAHDLRTDGWMNGPAVDTVEGPGTEEWMVKEEKRE